MSDTIRTRSQLQAMFPDNIVGLIVPQNDRDFIVSAFAADQGRNPGATDDNANTSGAGFFDQGQFWNNTGDGSLWFCESGTPSAATWVKVYPPPASGGTVTSVGLSLPSSVFNLSGTPVTSTGTLTGTFKNQGSFTVFCSPLDGSIGPPAFNAMVPDFIPIIDINTRTSGILEISRGGTGMSTVPGTYQTGTSPKRWYIAGSDWFDGNLSVTALTIVPGTYYAVPFRGNGLQIDQLAVYMTGTGSSGEKCRVGIYLNQASVNPYPGSLMVDAGEIDFGPPVGPGLLTSGAISFTPQVNTQYWAVFICDTSHPELEADIAAMQPSTGACIPIYGFDDSDNWTTAQQGQALQYNAGAYPTALPATFPGAINDGSAVILAAQTSGGHTPAVGMHFAAA